MQFDEKQFIKLSQFAYLRFADYVLATPHVECPFKGLCKNICEPPVSETSQKY